MRRGFTLIELLVVISVIALLAGLVAPMLIGAVEMARQAVCAAGMRNLAAGVRMYAVEHNGLLPIAEPMSRALPDRRHWFMNDSLLKHMNVAVRNDDEGQPLGPPMTGGALICPSHQTPGQWRDGTPQTYALSYGMNGTLGRGGRPDHLQRRRIDEFTSESAVMVFVDFRGRRSAPGIVLYHGCPRSNFDFRHPGGANAAFLDGHVNSIKEDDVPFGMANRFDPFWSTRVPQ